MKPGDIVFGAGNKKGHPIVFIEANDEYTFLGAMLTSTSFRGLNSQMSESHFEQRDANGIQYELKYKNSHVVPLRLLKKTEWEPFTKVGQLTKEGFSFVTQATGNGNPQYWEDAVKN